MEQEPTVSPPSPGQGQPGDPPPESPAARPARRRLVTLLLALHAASALAAVAVLMRAQRPQPSDDKRTGLKLLTSKQQDSVGWIRIHGVIRGGDGGRWDHGVEQWGRKLRTLAEKTEVKAIILEIDSPGGTVGAVQELHSAVLRVRREKGKPVVALLGDVAASGGYYLAAACDKVVAHPGTLVGSIGVIFNTMNVEGLFGKLGVRAEPIKSGKHKDIGSSTRPMTSEERLILQGLIDGAYGQFLHAVMEGRSLPETQARPLADGRIFTGDQAKALKLVDEVGDSRVAIEQAAALAGISGTPKVLRDGEPLENLLTLLELRLSRWLRPEAALLGELRDAAPSLEYRWSGF